MKEKLLVIIRHNKIDGVQLENVFLFVQMIYLIYTGFYWQTTTNWVQLNIPNDSKTFMGKTIHTPNEYFQATVTRYLTLNFFFHSRK